MFGNVAIKVAGDFGRGTMFTVISVTIPKVPSEPMKRCMRSSVVTNFFVALPTSIISPEERTTFNARTWCDVTPYLTQHIPPAFVATFPPRVDQSLLAGSGRYAMPNSFTAVSKSKLITPA